MNVLFMLMVRRALSNLMRNWGRRVFARIQKFTTVPSTIVQDFHGTKVRFITRSQVSEFVVETTC